MTAQIRSRSRQVVDDLHVERVDHRHAADADIVGEEVEEAPAGRDDPRALPLAERPLEHAARAQEPHRRHLSRLVPAALPQRELRDARYAVAERRRVAAGEERHVPDQLGVDQPNRSAGRCRGGEGVDVRDLDVVDDEQVLERAAAPDDQVVAEVVGPDDHARQRLGEARHVLQGPRRLLDVARRQQVAGRLDLLRRGEDRGGDVDRLGDGVDLRQHDLHLGVEPRAHLDVAALVGRQAGRPHLDVLLAQAYAREPELALAVGGGAEAGAHDADGDAGGGLAVAGEDDARDAPGAGGVLGVGARVQERGREQER